MFRRLVMLSTFLLLIPTVSAEEGPLTRTVSEFYDIAKKILSGSTSLIKALEEHQADAIVSEVYSLSTNLINEKQKIRQQIESGTNVVLNDKVTDSVVQIGLQLSRFGTEIDKVSGLTGGPLRNAAEDLVNHKARLLEEVNNALLKNDRKTALARLDDAIDSAKRIQQAAWCLNQTLQEKRQICDPLTLKPNPIEKRQK